VEENGQDRLTGCPVTNRLQAGRLWFFYLIYFIPMIYVAIVVLAALVFGQIEARSMNRA
jgi:hypothetical protein